MLREDPSVSTVSPEDRLRFDKAMSLLFRYQFEGKPLEQCWTEVHRDSKLDPETARHRAAEEIKWLRLNHPLTATEGLLLFDLDTDALIDDLGRQLSATRKIPTKTIKDAAGRVTVLETIECPDYRARSLAFKQLIELHGLPVSDSSFESSSDAAIS